MKKAAFLFLFCLSVVFNGYAQTKQEQIKELFKIMRQDSLIDKSFGTMIPTMMNQMLSHAKDSVSRAKAQQAIKMTMSVTMPVIKDIAKKMIDEDMVAIYDRYFTESEIKDFIAFYTSPSGQKFINVTPSIQKDMMMAMFQKYLPEIQKTMKAKLEELKAAEKEKSQGVQ